MKRSKLKSIMLGVKKKLLTPTLPEWIVLLNKRLYVRIFRVLGLYSSTTLLINSNKEYPLDYPLYLIVVFLILTTLNFIYYC